MLNSNNQFEAELKKRIAEEIDRLKDNLAIGLAVTDYPKYQHLIGQIFAFRTVVDSYCDEVTTAINKR
jgi:hypothetical protein